MSQVKTSPTEVAEQDLGRAPHLTKLQLFAASCAIVIFTTGSQVFYLIPFYMYYPTLVCESGSEKFECTREQACHDENSYSFDWSDHNTLDNFMTMLDLICEQPYKVGLVGSVSFIAFAIGSFFFTKQADKYGRYRVVCLAALFTPIGLLVFITMSKQLGLYGIYAVFFLLGLTYNPRGSTAYLYGAEILPKSCRLYFNVLNFGFDAVLTTLVPVYFYYVGSVRSFFAVVAVIFSSALASFYFLLPESPSFLLSQGDVAGYQRAMYRLTGQKIAVDDSQLALNSD